MRIAPEAEADLSSAQDWYEHQREGLGAEVLLCLEEAFDRIATNPNSHPVVYKDVRRALPHRLPYAAYYRIEESEVRIIPVLHFARSPRVWRSRS